MTTPAGPSTIAIGNQYYGADWDGFRDYLEASRASDPTLYRALNPKLTSLEEQRTLGNIVIWSSVIVGVGLVTWGFVALLSGPDPSECRELPAAEEESCERDQDDERDAQLRQFLILEGMGFGIGIAGGILGAVMRPGRSDFLTLVNDHNRLKPSNPMRLQLGFDPKVRRAFASVSFEFDLSGIR